MDKVLLSSCKPPVRGVELFNINLMKELAQAGMSLVVPVHGSWMDIVRDRNSGVNIDLLDCSITGGPVLNGLVAMLKLRKRTFDVMLLANTANSLVPFLVLSPLFGIADRCVLIAHREPRKYLVHVQAGMRTTVVAVNKKIASHYNPDAFERIEVYYGVIGAERFSPGQPLRKDGIVRFCVVGQLDNAWKGADTAVAAFRGMREDVRKHCQLILASFSYPPLFEEDNIIVRKWMDLADIAQLLKDVDVLIVPSRDEIVMRETFSQAMVQGMLSGLPVIVSDLPVLAEKIDEGGGVIFRDTAELSEMMSDMAKSPEKRQRLGRDARNTALARYVWNTEYFIKQFISDQ